MPPSKKEKPEPKSKPKPKPRRKLDPSPPPPPPPPNMYGTVGNNFGKVVNNFFRSVDEKILKRLGIEQRFGFALLGLLVIAGFVGIFLALRPNEKNIMTGEFRIAIASFVENGNAFPKDLGYTIADGINIRLTDDLQEITVGPKVTIWGPDKVGVIEGFTAEDRAGNAEDLAKKIQAHMVIYGAVEETSTGMRVIPEFYLDKQGFHEGSEVIGQYALGSPFPLPGADNPAWQFNFDKQMRTRTDIISSLAEGLSYFAVYEYEAALQKLNNIESIEGWEDDQGKEVLYALIGFAAGKAKQYDLTQSSLEKAIELNPDYARPYIGMANLNYVLALQPMEESKDVKDVDQNLLDKCFDFLELAVQAPEKPPLAEVDTKIRFARGQCYWLKAFTGRLPDYSLAEAEFKEVIKTFGDGENPRVREFAAESHARLGLIASLTNDLPNALVHYQEAVDLLSDNLERQALYQERVDDLKQRLSQPTP